jgi:glycosyltransferase involved in cell wall biosynthesis
MNASPLVSIVIDNYNYGPFLSAAIDSALEQSYPLTEVVVVDDGSTDDSRGVISEYGARVRGLFQPNGGQASALNRGFAASKGDVVIFLDADDELLPTAAANAAERFQAPGTAKVHWPLWEVDGEGRRNGRIVPEDELPAGDLRETLLQDGPAGHVNPPMSGNAWSRTFLEQVLPIPEDEYRIWADVYLLELAPLFGVFERVVEPQGLYRLHGTNRYATRPFAERLARGVELYDGLCGTLARRAQMLGVALDADDCRAKSWFHRVQRSIDELCSVLPPESSFLLVDEDEWGTDAVVEGRRRIPFPEQGGVYWGRPADDEAAVAELDRQRDGGADALVVAWPAFWWLQHYHGFAKRVRTSCRCLLENERIVVFDLRST